MCYLGIISFCKTRNIFLFVKSHYLLFKHAPITYIEKKILLPDLQSWNVIVRNISQIMFK